VPRALVCRFTDPKRSDVLVFSYPPDESREFMKRIVAIGGDDLHIEDQKIYVNCTSAAPSGRAIQDPRAHWMERLGRARRCR
jgi:signal peptidase I